MPKAEYPKDHSPGLRVPKGGSSCANCRYLRAGNTCANEYFQQWHGSNKIPAPANEYCSDWWEQRAGRKSLGEQVREQRERK